MSFYSFLQTGGHSITFSINSMDVQYFTFCSQEYLNWLTTDILQLLSVMQILTEWDVAMDIISWGLTPALSISVETFWAQPGFRPLRAMWLFERWHFSRTHLPLWIWVSGYRTQVNSFLCQHCLPWDVFLAVVFFFFFLSAVTERHRLHIHIHAYFCHTCSSWLQHSFN